MSTCVAQRLCKAGGRPARAAHARSAQHVQLAQCALALPLLRELRHPGLLHAQGNHSEISCQLNRALAPTARVPPTAGAGLPCAHEQQRCQLPGGTSAPAPPAAASAVVSTRGGQLDPSLLELPGNSEATIRLLKARVRALEEQLQAAADCAAGELC